jgi:5S rRNA maturation endonuclease (ribonuclease M5)
MYSTREIEDNITFDKIFNLVDDYFIYCYYLGKEIKINKPICSPIREDKHPSWSLYRDKKGVLKYKDFATGDSGNVVTMLQKMENLNYNEALRKIWKDIVIKKSVPSKKKTDLVLPDDRIGNNIEIKRKNFTDKDSQFWNQYHITKDTLKLYKVFPISTFWVNEIQGNFFYTEKEPMFAYNIYDKYKIYRPYSKRTDKWRNNCTSYDIQGIEQLSDIGDLLIITKSLKDVMVLHELGYNAIAPQSETSSIPKVIMDHLKLRFKKIVILFDYDEGGIKGAKKLSEKYSIKDIFIPKHYLDLYSIKDVSDFIKEFDKESTLIMIKELLNENTSS